LFFPDGTEVTFDYGVVQLLLAIKFNDEALDISESALEEFGRKPARLYVYALVLLRFERNDEAKAVLEEALAAEPDYGPALRLYDERFGEPKTRDDSDIEHLVARYSDSNVAQRALDVYNENGAVLIQDMFPKEMMQELRTAFMQRFEDWKQAGLGDPNFVGNKRYTVPLRIQEPFNDPRLWANPVLLDLLTEVMGDRPILNAFGSVVTYAGANTQHVHREHPILFSDPEVNKGLPTHAVTILVPLVDLNEELGGTQLWEGTNKQPELDEPEGKPTVVYTPSGSMLVFDYLTFHGGMASSSEEIRPVLFLTYSLPWFRDSLAFESHFALGISESELAAIPSEHRDLFRFATKLPE
jgi:tetratricopeptide (TPR) repeat protein